MSILGHHFPPCDSRLGVVWTCSASRSVLTERGSEPLRYRSRSPDAKIAPFWNNSGWGIMAAGKPCRDSVILNSQPNDAVRGDVWPDSRISSVEPHPIGLDLAEYPNLAGHNVLVTGADTNCKLDLNKFCHKVLPKRHSPLRLYLWPMKLDYRHQARAHVIFFAYRFTQAHS